LPAGPPSTTDDLGQYRISGLQPGRYQVLALPTETWRNEKKETLGSGATYFPGTTLPQLAQAITLGISEERHDLDLALAANRTVRLRGRVQQPTGESVSGAQVGLSYSLTPGAIVVSGSAATRTAADGTFEFRNISPGTYMVRSGGASQTLPLGAADVDSVLLVPRTGNTISATITTDEGGTPPFPASGVRVALVAQPGAEVLPTVRLPAVDNDWTVRMTNVGGPFLFRMNNLPDTWMLHSVRVGERDITDVPWEVPTGGVDITDVRIVITQKTGRVSGSVVGPNDEPARDATIVVFSEESADWIAGSRFLRSTRPTADGSFNITGLPSGTYFAVARDAVMDGEWESREFLKRAAEDAVRVTLAPGESTTVSLKVPR
jgi:hypothetical protein